MNDPTFFHPALTAERLSALARVIVRARRGALDLHDPISGESNLSLGTRTRERACEAYRQLAREVDWLTCFEQGYYFLLLLGEGRLPIKFHRTDPDDPAPRTTRELAPEASYKQYAFAFAAVDQPVSADDVERSWRLFFQDDPETREVYSVTLARVRPSGVVDERWEIDLTEPVTTSVSDAGGFPEPAELESPAVAPLPTTSPKKADGN